jgi:hypothetical protein
MVEVVPSYVSLVVAGVLNGSMVAGPGPLREGDGVRRLRRPFDRVTRLDVQ